MSLLLAICKDKSRHTRWKSLLVKTILETRKKIPFPIHSALHCCCRNIKEFGTFDEEADINADKSLQGRKEDDDGEKKVTIYNSVHCEIAMLLLSSGADINVPDASGESCLGIAENYPALRDLLTKTEDAESISIIPWTSKSKRYNNILKKVSMQQECDFSLISYWYHKNSIRKGNFGEIFVGISVNDGREVAIKRIEKLRIEKLQQPRDRREVKSLTALADCQKVVRYLNFVNNEEFSYVVLELMEGNLEEYLSSSFDTKQSVQLCQDVVMGMKYLHENNILHRDLKPRNILYKVRPKLCLKIADFGLSRCMDSSGSSTVYSINSGTKCWMAPEVLMSTHDHSKASDMFSCGLVLHFVLSVKRHPFAPANLANKKESQVANETEANIKNSIMDGWDNSLSPEATHLVKRMLESNEGNRTNAKGVLEHPLFWSKKKKIDFLDAVGDQTEFECPRLMRAPPLTPIETDLEKNFRTIVRHGNWSGSGYVHMPAIYTGMTTTGRGRRNYNTSSAVELVRFIRNVYEHYREKTFSTPVPIEQMLFDDFVFLKHFPVLVMEVYKAVTTYGWNQTRHDIKSTMNDTK